MIIGIIGSGGREHSIGKILIKSKKIKKIYFFPGNAGTQQISTNVDLNTDSFEVLKNFILKKKIEMVIIGPEKPLVNGIVDYLEKFNIKVFGPNKSAAKLEGSKIFTKQICEKYKIPTAKFKILENKKNTFKYLDSLNYPIVIKADNLASGKGVYICNTKKEAYTSVNEIFNGKFGKAKKILLEEFLEGEEMSYFIVSDGITYKFFGSAQDHKRALDGDKGKNTGGMGAYSPSRLLNDKIEKKIKDKIINPTLKALKNLKIKYKGFLYVGLMIVKNEPYLIEYNVRMGDPECQTIIPLLKTPLLDVFNACCNKKLKNLNIKWSKNKSICVVVCSKGYPDDFKKNIPINNIEKISQNKNNYLFHAGTIVKNEKVVTSGGRVLNFVSLSKKFINSKKNVYQNIKKLNWTKGFYRKDIGYKVIN